MIIKIKAYEGHSCPVWILSQSSVGVSRVLDVVTLTLLDASG